LQLEWQTDSQPMPDTVLQGLHASAASLTLPDAALLHLLREALELGYPKG
jgi:hypothetical protein